MARRISIVVNLSSGWFQWRYIYADGSIRGRVHPAKRRVTIIASAKHLGETKWHGHFSLPFLLMQLVWYI